MAVEPDFDTFLRCALANPAAFARLNSRVILRPYQEAAARAIADSILNQRGLSLVVMFPRQSGKNELQANLESWLLTLYAHLDLDIIKVSPTWKPQSLNAMHRLERLLKSGTITKTLWKKESGYIYRLGRARISFFSGEAQAHIVGGSRWMKRRMWVSPNTTRRSPPWLPAPTPPVFSGVPRGPARRCWHGNCARLKDWRGRMASVGCSASAERMLPEWYPPTMPFCANRCSGWAGSTPWCARNSTRKRSMVKRACSVLSVRL